MPKGFIHEYQLLKKFPKLEEIKVGDKMTGTLLYVKPFVNFAFFKVFTKSPDNWPFEYGDLVSGKVQLFK